ncbi:MAG TPA: hypothetical protein VFN55_14495 [Solirubrobacteraceae bacterium]|nr:hypothetical protein [Solirubrobacteraceae bacterium]
MSRRVVCALPGTVALALALAAILLPGAAGAARLVGGREQAAILHAFARGRGSKPEQATSVRRSTVIPAWTVVRWVVPARGTERRPPRPVLRSSYFHVTARGVTAGSPPPRVRRDLAAPMSVSVLYTGSGSETIAYSQSSRSTCVGNGNYVDSETVSVSPMSWTVRYTVNLDRLQAAVSDGRSVAVLPTVSFDRGGSALNASEAIMRSSVDQGCFGPTRTIRCTARYFLHVPGAAVQLGLGPSGLQIGIPMAPVRRGGDCYPQDYPLGPSLWASGAGTALVAALSLTGGRLPPDPYAPVPVRWPLSSAGTAQGALASPCQGITAMCTDAMRWAGTVRLLALS